MATPYTPMVATGQGDEGELDDDQLILKARLGQSRRSTWRRYAGVCDDVAGTACNAACFCVPIIDPARSPGLHVWDGICAVMIALVSVISPFEASFLAHHDSPLLYLNLIIDVLFIADMFLQFNVMTPNPRLPSVMLKDHYSIAKHYLQGWFWIDLLSMIQGDFVVLMNKLFISTPPTSFKTPGVSFKFIRLLRLLRMLRVTRLQRLIHRWHTTVGFSYASTSLVKFFCLVIVCCHWTACLWGSLAMQADYEGASSWLSALRHSKGDKDEYHSVLGVYCVSLYWSVVTLTSVGYGDIVPQNALEYVTCTVCMAAMASTWAYVIGAVCGVIATLSPHEIAFKNKMDNLNTLMADWEMPQKMRQKVRRFFYEGRCLTQHRAEQDIIGEMSPLLQGETAYFVHGQWVEKVWYLKRMKLQVIVMISRKLILRVYGPTEEIREDRKLAIVRHGVAFHRGRILSVGDVWGEDQILLNSFLREEPFAMTMTFCHVFFLRAYDLEQVVEGEHEEKTLKWAKARIGLTRAMERIARSIKGLDAGKRSRWDNLDEDGRNAIIARVLSNMFHPSHLEDAFLRRNLELREIDDVPGMLKRILIRLDDIENEHKDSTKMLANRLGKLEHMMWTRASIDPSVEPEDSPTSANGQDHEEKRREPSGNRMSVSGILGRSGSREPCRKNIFSPR